MTSYLNSISSYWYKEDASKKDEEDGQQMHDKTEKPETL